MDPSPNLEEGFAQWPGYYLAVFDLSDKHQLRVGNNTFDVRRPFFHCGADPIVHGVFSQNDVPVFCDLPEIKWDGKANLSLTIDDKPQGNIDIASDELTVLLDKPGDYLIELRGPLGENMRKHFVLIPGLTVQADPPVMWPTKKTVKWHISTNAGNIQSGNILPPFTRNGPDLEFNVVYADYEIELRAKVPQLLWRLLPQQEGHDWTREPMSLWLDMRQGTTRHPPAAQLTIPIKNPGLPIRIAPHIREGAASDIVTAPMSWNCACRLNISADVA